MAILHPGRRDRKLASARAQVRRLALWSPEDAEDAAQEALLILYRKIGTLRATGALASWMFRIATSACVALDSLSLDSL